MMRTFTLLIFIIAAMFEPTAQRLETNFYNIPELDSKHFAPSNSGDDSKRLDDFIKDNQKPLKIYFEPGVYHFNKVEIPSNVHLQFDEKALLRAPEDTDSIVMFSVGADTETVQNISISSKNGGRFTIDISDCKPNQKVRVLLLQNVKKFRIENFVVEDNYSKLSAISYDIATYIKKDKEQYGWPRNGNMSNILLKQSHNGYGTVQIKAGEDIGFSNLDGIGGVTLRVETRGNLTNEKKVGIVNNLKAYDIRCSNGDAAVSLEPHTRNQGVVTIAKIDAESCNYALKLEAGVATESSNKGGILVPGTFDSESSISDITTTYGLACQLKFKNIQRLTPDEQQKIVQVISEDQISFRGPSAAAVSNLAATPGKLAAGENGYYSVHLSDITLKDFPEGAVKVQYEKDKYPYSLDKKTKDFDSPYGVLQQK